MGAGASGELQEECREISLFAKKEKKKKKKNTSRTGRRYRSAL